MQERKCWFCLRRRERHFVMVWYVDLCRFFVSVLTIRIRFTLHSGLLVCIRLMKHADANDSFVPLRLDTRARVACGDAQAWLKWWKRKACCPCGEDERRSGQHALSALRTCASRGIRHCTDVVDSLATYPFQNPDQSVLPSLLAYEDRQITEHRLPPHKVVRAVQERLAGAMD